MKLDDVFWHLKTLRTSRVDGFVVRTDRRIPLNIRKKLCRGTYEAPEREALKQFVRPEDRILEIGSALGIMALTCARAVSGKSLHYEPNPAMHSIIRENFRLNGMDCNLVEKAVTVAGGPVTLQIDDDFRSSSILDRGFSRAIKVDSDPINEVIASFAPTVLVMDAEGAELQLVEASQLCGVRLIILEAHAELIGESGVRRICECLSGNGFDCKVSTGGRKNRSFAYLKPD